jgi:hypothetical protein
MTRCRTQRTAPSELGGGRSASSESDPPSSQLEIARSRPSPIEDGRAQVRAEVQPVWWGAPPVGSRHHWRDARMDLPGPRGQRLQVAVVEPFTWSAATFGLTLAPAE